MESDIGAGNYLDVIGDARLKASGAMVSQGATVFGGALLTPAAASIGSAATVQAPFWGGVGAQTAATGSRELGSRLIVNKMAMEEAAATGALRANIIVTDVIYGSSTVAGHYILGSNILGIFDGAFGIMPGPPGYVPDGFPDDRVTYPYREGQAAGAILKDAFYFYKERVGND